MLLLRMRFIFAIFLITACSSQESNLFISGTISQFTKLIGAATHTVVPNSVFVRASSGNDTIFVTGSTTGGLNGATQTGTTDCYLTKYNYNGLHQWTIQIGAAAANTYGTATTVDAVGNIYVTGYTDGVLEGSLLATTEVFVAKYSTTGSRLWLSQFPIAANTYPTAINVVGTNIFISGYLSGNYGSVTATGTNDLFVARISSTGSLDWSTHLGVAASNTYSYGMAVSGSDIYLTGSTNGALFGSTLTGATDLFVAKFTSGASNPLWVELLGDTGATTVSRAIVIGETYLYITGHTNGNLDGETLTGTNDLFVSQYNLTGGSPTWTKLLGVIGASTYARSIAIKGKQLVISGDTGGGLYGNTHTAGGGNTDMFIAKYFDTGALSWLKLLGVAGQNTVAKGAGIDSGNRVFVSGYTTGNLDGNILTGAQDMFLSRYLGNGAH